MSHYFQVTVFHIMTSHADRLQIQLRPQKHGRRDIGDFEVYQSLVIFVSLDIRIGHLTISEIIF